MNRNTFFSVPDGNGSANMNQTRQHRLSNPHSIHPDNDDTMKTSLLNIYSVTNNYIIIDTDLPFLDDPHNSTCKI